MTQIAEEVQIEEDSEAQCAAIMRYLKRYPYITRVSALAELDVANITARISELRQRGEPIETLMVKHVKANGRKTRHAKWYLEAA